MEVEIYFRPARQIENTGDLLINKIEIELLRKYGSTIIDDSDTPSWYIDQLNPDGLHTLMTSFSNESLYKTIWKRLKINRGRDRKVIYLVLPPGHTSRKGRKAAKNTLNNFLKLYLLKLYGCKIIRTGFSIGPFDTLNGIVEALNTRAYDHCSLRDQSSMKLARQLNFKSPKFSPDLAWAYKPDIPPVAGRNYIVISMRSNSYGETHSSKYLKPIKERMLEILTAILPVDTQIVFSYQVIYDRDAGYELCDHFKAQFPKSYVLDKKLLLDDAVKLYAGAKCVFSNRLHVLLLAIQSKTLALPFVKDNDNRKITSIYGDNGLAKYMLYSDGDIQAQIENLRQTLLNEQEIIKVFSTRVESNEKKIVENLDSIFL